MAVKLISLDISNIRGFTFASLRLENSALVIVGENNSGKSAALLILNWIFNSAEVDTRYQGLVQRGQDWDVLSPARNVGRSARRIALKVRFQDGRTARKFRSNNDKETLLRFDMKVVNNRIVAKLGAPGRSETLDSDPKALELLTLLQNTFHFEHVSAYREVSSAQFRTSLSEVFEKKLSELATHNVHGGTTAKYRQYNNAFSTFERLATDELTPVLVEMAKSISPGLLMGAAPLIDVDKKSLAILLAKNTQLRLTTGEHDEKMVPAVDVGSGLQSSLNLALRDSQRDRSKKQILALDEPEAFLHPSAQRSFARSLLKKTSGRYKTLVTTHSPTILEEAEYSQIIVAAGQSYYAPDPSELHRSEINNMYLSGQGAEMMFAKSVLVVEGASDQLFFETLRRRFAEQDDTGQIDRAFVVAADGKNSFSPWMKLLGSYVNEKRNRHFHWLVVADGDAASAVNTALTHASIEKPNRFERVCQQVATGLAERDMEGWRASISSFNDLCERDGLPVRLLTADLEYAALHNVSFPVLRQIRTSMPDFLGNGRDQLIKWLCSKGIDGIAADNQTKHPWRRKVIAGHLSLSNLDDSIKSVLRQWFAPFSLSNPVTRLIKGPTEN